MYCPQFAALSVLEHELGILRQLETYAAQAQELFDMAHDTVRAACRDSVAATSVGCVGHDDCRGRRGTGFDGVADRPHDWVCSIEECEAVLRDVEVVDPQE